MPAQEPAKVLVVDDERLICELLIAALTSAGFEVTAVGTGEAALRMLDLDTFAVALVDIRLPGMDGVSVLEQLHARPARPAVILMTGYPDTSTESRLGALSHEGLLRKPFSIREMLRVVNALVQP